MYKKILAQRGKICFIFHVFLHIMFIIHDYDYYPWFAPRLTHFWVATLISVRNYTMNLDRRKTTTNNRIQYERFKWTWEGVKQISCRRVMSCVFLFILFTQESTQTVDCRADWSILIPKWGPWFTMDVPDASFPRPRKYTLRHQNPLLGAFRMA